jgi:hypothetical protein
VNSNAVVAGIIQQWVKGMNQVKMGEVHLQDKMECLSLYCSDASKKSTKIISLIPKN